MDVHHPHKPIRNWREFAKEVGIIVLGVLIAIGGEQAVEEIHHRAEVREAREALNEELGWDLASLKNSMDQSRCTLARLSEIERWVKSWDAGHALQLSGQIPVPSYYVFRTSSWRVISGDTVGRMPLKERIAYASLYDLLDAVEKQRTQMEDAWVDIALYQHARRLTEDQFLHITKDIEGIRALYDVMGANYATGSDIAKGLGIEPSKLPTSNWGQGRKVAECTPMLVG